MSTSATVNVVDNLNGLLKEVYPNGIVHVVPEATKLLKSIGFKQAEALGNYYHQPVLLSGEHGFTLKAARAGAFSLNAPVSAVMKDATLEGAQLVLRSRIDYETAARASGSKASFADATKLMFENMGMAISKRLELMLLYGQTGIGLINATTSSATTFVISAVSWAPAIWAGMEGCRIDIVKADKSDFSSATGCDSATVSSVDLDTRTVTLAAAATAIAADIVFFEDAVVPGGTPVYNEFAGLDKILTTTSGNLFGISATTYAMWRPLAYAVSGSLTITHILKAVVQAVSRGLMEDVMVLVSPKAWQNLINPVVDPVAIVSSVAPGARKLMDSKSSVEFGADAIKIRGLNGSIQLEPHMYVKEGEAFAIPLKHFKRVGSSDVTYKTPGRGDEIFTQLADSAGYEVRAYSNMALFCDSPAKCVKLTAIS